MANQPPLGARLCDRLIFRRNYSSATTESLVAGLPSTRHGLPAIEEEPEEAPTARERAHWAALGLGCTWFINDTMFLQLPYWVASQPEGLKLGGNISFAASVANPVTVLLALLLRCSFSTFHPQPSLIFCVFWGVTCKMMKMGRRFAFRATMRAVVPVLICLSLAAGGVLACGGWRLSSWFIYLAVVLASTVGGLTPWLTIPWMLHSGYKPALVSPLFLGGNSAANLDPSASYSIENPD